MEGTGDPVLFLHVYVSGDFPYLELLLLVLLVMLPAALLAGRYRTLLIAVGLGALGLAFAGVGLLLLSPRDLVQKYLVLTHLLPPSLLALALIAIFGTAVLLGVLARIAWQRLRMGATGNRSSGGHA